MESKITLSTEVFDSHLICRICGDKARGMNFDVITCVSCKAFFRRNAIQSKIHRCQRQNKCKITRETRSSCSACRLRKCYVLGMNPRLIQATSQCAMNFDMCQQLIMEKQQQQLELLFPTPLDLLQNDRLTLTTEEWNLLSNTLRSYDEHDHINRMKHLLNEKSSLPPKLRTKAFDIFNLVQQFLIGIQSIIERSPHLQLSSKHARRSLVQRNMYTTASIDALLVCRELDAFHNTSFTTAVSAIYGSDRVMAYARNVEKLESNGNLIKLFEFVLIFSSNLSVVIFNNQEQIEIMLSSIEAIRIQDIYVNMFWKYLVYLYGYNEAAHRFSTLVKVVLDVISEEHQLTEVAAHKVLVDRVAID